MLSNRTTRDKGSILYLLCPVWSITHMLLLSTENMDSKTRATLIVFNFNLSSCKWLLAVILYRAGLISAEVLNVGSTCTSVIQSLRSMEFNVKRTIQNYMYVNFSGKKVFWFNRFLKNSGDSQKFKNYLSCQYISIISSNIFIYDVYVKCPHAGISSNQITN